MAMSVNNKEDRYLSVMADEYQCDLCGASFDNEDELREHNQEEHGDEME